MMFEKLRKDWAILNVENRNYMVDNMRALAILMVVIHHFNQSLLKVGFLGVDVFFVISGYLVSSAILKEIKHYNGISFRNFYIKRVFKILPSYYFFLIVGSLILKYYSYLFEEDIAQLSFSNIFHYLFFLQNYSGYKTFYHIWSLCVEEHFYIILPIAIYTIMKLWNSFKLLGVSLVLVIFLGNFARITGYFVGFETYAATHNRIDALAWGVLLSVISIYLPFSKKLLEFTSTLAIFGVLIFLSTLFFTYHSNSGELFKDFFSHLFMPISIFLILLGTISKQGSFHLKTLSFVSFYSYNWYLWHEIFLLPIKTYFGTNIFSFILYFLFSFFIAFITTHFIEIPIVKKRKTFLNDIKISL